jgi:pectate lyase
MSAPSGPLMPSSSQSAERSATGGVRLRTRWLTTVPVLLVVPALLLPYVGPGGLIASPPAVAGGSSQTPQAFSASPSGSAGVSASPTTSPTAAPTPTVRATPTLPPSPPASGAYVGYGAASVGGRGGVEIVVRNLNDAGPGSLRAALDASGPRIVVFTVGGTITLRDDLRIVNPYITVAGETARAPGIVVRNGALKIETHDVVLRHIRLRPGDQVSAPGDVDALTINGVGQPATRIVVDHVSMVWGPDIGGLAILGNVHDVTISNSIMGEGLYLSRHPEATAKQGGHSMAANITQLDANLPFPERITFWRNLFTTSDTRMPRLQGARCVDIVNNVIYNWGIHPPDGNPRGVNVVNNWYRSGPETVTRQFWTPQTSEVAPTLFRGTVYLSGNVADGFNGSKGGPLSAYATSLRCGGLSVVAGGAAAAYASVVAGVGATLPVRDVVDRRILTNVTRRTGAFFNGAGYPPPNPYWPS